MQYCPNLAFPYAKKKTHKPHGSGSQTNNSINIYLPIRPCKGHIAVFLLLTFEKQIPSDSPWIACMKRSFVIYQQHIHLEVKGPLEYAEQSTVMATYVEEVR